MNRRYRIFAISGGLAAITATSLYFAGINPIGLIGKEPEAVIPPACEAREVRLVRLQPRSDSANATRIELKREDTPRRDIPLEVAEEAALWRISEPDLGEADLLFVQRIVSSLCKIPTAFPLANKDRAELGLDNPNFEIELIDSEPLQIQFGNALPDRRVAVWISRGDKHKGAFSIPEKFLQWLQVPVDRIRNRKLLRMPLEGIDLVILKRNEKEVFSLERQGADWKIEAEGKETEAVGEEAQKFINRLATMQALDIREQKASAEECEKQAHDFEVLFEAANRSREFLRFSLPKDLVGDGQKRSIGCSSSREAIFSVHPEVARYLEIKPEKFSR